ncbi:DNA ligase I, ATP-dependent Dnl1 [Micromonospora sp. ATCC 39149]|nr:DNA ligase I, ATP-dependent Dnl1 [Micromonospora sp. ATCC 39149]
MAPARRPAAGRCCTPSSPPPPPRSSGCCAACSAASCARALRPGCWPTRSPGPPTCRRMPCAGPCCSPATCGRSRWPRCGAARLRWPTSGSRWAGPLAPMLAASAPSVDEALALTGVPAVVDVKLDGIRAQVHRSGSDIAVFTRSLDEITARVPEVVAAVRALPARELVLDGEAIGLDATGRPLPFQQTSSRAARRATPSAGGTTPNIGDAMPGAGGPAPVAPAVLAAAETTGEAVLTPYFFDLLHLDGDDLIDRPGHERWAALASVVDPTLLVGRMVVDGPEAAGAAFAAALDAGQEGVVVKDPDAPYDAGRRGAAWVKVKPRHTLDLVVLAVEWGSGRRSGWLSNLHLGARDPATGGFVMLGKTFKGLTDEVLRWQTERFLALAVERGDWVVRVRPEQVVEIAFDGVQTSSRYPGGMTLRFARVVRYRGDKTAAEADTIDAVRAIHAGRHPA